MHQNKRESILNCLSNIINNSPNTLLKNCSVNSRLFVRDGIRLHLLGENLDNYNHLLEELLNGEKWGEKFSEKYVDGVLQDAVFSIAKHGIDKAREGFIEACNTVEAYSIEQTVYVPVGGIYMYDVEELTLGKVQFRKVTHAKLEELLKLTQVILRTTKHSSDEQEFFIRQTDKDLSQSFVGRVCAVYQVVADSDRAKELAEQETQSSLDLLRYSIPALYADKDRVEINLLSEVASGVQPMLALSFNGFVQSWSQGHRDYEVTQKSLETLKKIGVFEISEILKKPYERLNEFEKTLLRGLHWFASSQTQARKENEFLNLITCLEVFFTQKGGNPISNSVAEGTALILSKELAERKRLKKRIGDLYRRRSEISHGGHLSILNKDVADLKSIAMELIVRIIERRNTFTSRKELTDWLEDQRLS